MVAQKGVLPEITKKALDELSPVFVDKLIENETEQISLKLKSIDI
jgi:hypothetical protein